MKLLQSDLLKIQAICKKEFEAEYSNNAESEYVKIYDDDEVEEIIENLLDYIEDLERELDHKKEELDDVIDDRDTNYKRISVAEQTGISDRDFV